MTTRPESLGRLGRLRENRIEVLPPWIARLPALEKLDLRWNTVDDGADPVPALREGGCVVLT
ncbi:hypothetical protein [Streptomyces decoyicus]|uniref:hypothetical protein n=1 Tax=Streptomyces decoyicus TaxID=249567 RepID=UPI0033BA8B02